VRRILNILVVSIAFLTFAGCSKHYHSSGPQSQPQKQDPVLSEPVGKKHGPPPHAPAHGYRAKHEKADLRYDSKLRCYEVVGHRDHYYQDGVYFRWTPNGWEASATISGEWGTVTIERVPDRLRGRYNK